MNGQNRDPRSSSAYRTGAQTRPYSARSQSASGRPYGGQARGGYAPNAGRGYSSDARPQRSSYSRSYPGRNPNARPVQQARPQQRRRPAGKNSFGKLVLKVLQVIAGVFIAIFAGIGSVLKAINRKLDVFRKTEVSAVIVNCILGGVLVCVLLCIFMAMKPGIDAGRAVSLASKGDSVAANSILTRLENKGYDAEKLEKTRFGVVEGLIEAGKYSEAETLLGEMSASVETAQLRQRSNYEKAISLYDGGSYSAAAQIFYQMGDYEDSSLRYADCRCALAIQAYLEGNENSARSLLLDVPDVEIRVANAARKVAASEAEAQAILSAPLFSAENLNQMEATMAALAAARSDMPEGRIAAGKRHTLGLSSNGTVYAAGDNSWGQLNVSGWSGVTQVAAGAYHSVGLLSNGTVVAVGDNSQGQCDVSGWTDVVAVAAAAYDTIGLKADGSVVACGMHASSVSGWHGASHVAGGSYSMGCIYDKGAMLSSHPGAQMDMGVQLYDLSVCGPVSVGVLYDGSLISTYENAPDWGELVSATAMETGILAIDVSGQVRSFFYRPGDAVEISVSAEAVEVESSGTHHVVLTAGGRVYCFGDNTYGQCNTGDWIL